MLRDGGCIVHKETEIQKQAGAPDKEEIDEQNDRVFEEFHVSNF